MLHRDKPEAGKQTIRALHIYIEPKDMLREVGALQKQGISSSLITSTEWLPARSRFCIYYMDGDVKVIDYCQEDKVMPTMCGFHFCTLRCLGALHKGHVINWALTRIRNKTT